MQLAMSGKKSEAIPRKRQKHYSYDESVDEPSKLIEDEAVDVEREVPAEENEPVERTEQEDDETKPALEDDQG